MNEENGNAQDAKRHLSVVKSTETTSLQSLILERALLTGTPTLNDSSSDKSNHSVKAAMPLKQKEKTVSDLKIGDKVKATAFHSPVAGKIGIIKDFPYDGLAWVEFGTPGEEYGISTKDLAKVTETIDTLEKNRIRGAGGAPTRATTLPDDPADRKNYPIASGVLDYFPDALVAISRISKAGNDQHNPGLPLRWTRSKSGDESDTCIRHFLQRGTIDTDGQRHTAKAAWRMLAILQKEIEAEQDERLKK